MKYSDEMIGLKQLTEQPRAYFAYKNRQYRLVMNCVMNVMNYHQGITTFLINQ
jgi:hypothetical protein